MTKVTKTNLGNNGSRSKSSRILQIKTRSNFSSVDKYSLRIPREDELKSNSVYKETGVFSGNGSKRSRTTEINDQDCFNNDFNLNPPSLDETKDYKTRVEALLENSEKIIKLNARDDNRIKDDVVQRGNFVQLDNNDIKIGESKQHLKESIRKKPGKQKKVYKDSMINFYQNSHY